jgi:glycosyltransferase involved in cell wall biosynthesis
VSPSYGAEKVSYGVGPQGYTFRKLTRLPVHRLERQGTFLRMTPVLLDYPVELVHTFNELPIGIRPFVVSFENELPRFLGRPTDWQVDFGHRLLASARCRRILALTDAAAKALRLRLGAIGLADVASKISVYRGMVTSPPIGDALVGDPRRTDGPLRVLFIGRDAFGKGLLPTLDALDACRAQGTAIEATVVCGFESRSYISKGNDPDQVAVIARMERTPGLAYHPHLSNEAVRTLMQRHDVLAFPTLDESLGWVAIEASMAGMVVISTDIFAIPEIVKHEKTGLLISIDKNEAGRWIGLWQEGLEFNDSVRRVFETIAERLCAGLVRLSDDRSLLTRLGMEAKVHSQKLYGQEGAAVQLQLIYDGAVSP